MALVFASNAARGNNIGGYEWQSREVTGGTSTALYPATPQPTVNYPNTWLRFQRTGNTFIGYCSQDGVWWTEYMRQTVALPATIYLGLAATSHNTATLTTAKFHLQSTRSQPWYFPSRTDCITCHNSNAGGVLGPKTRQLNGSMLFPNGVTDNQLRSWAHIGLFNTPPADASLPNLDALAAQGDTNASLEKRARSYLDSNCASCHRPGGVQALWDARYDTPLGLQGILYGRLVNHLGDPTSCVVVPQDLSRSILYHRANTIGPDQMPPLAKNQVDDAGVALLAQWINSLSPNVPPTVALTSPPSGAFFNQADTVTITATASDVDGIQRVEFYDGPLKIGEDTSSPYSVTWTGADPGQHSIYAVAVDGVGNTNASSAASVIIRGAPLPGWTRFDVEGVLLASSASYSPQTDIFTVNGAGGDFWGTSDALTFLYRQISGNVTITARVLSMDHSDIWAKAGVMIRDTLAGNSRAVISVVTPSNGAQFQYRTSTGGSAAAVDGPTVTAPYWVRLTRAGNVFTAYVSPDGNVWTQTGTRTITIATTAYVGLVVASHNTSVLNTTRFDNVSVVTPNPSVAVVSPAFDSSLYNPTSVPITAVAASGGTDPISSVSFYVDGALVGSDTSAPYTFIWTPGTYGTHFFSARATDSAGRIGYSPEVPVTLNFPNQAGWRGEYFHDRDLAVPGLVRLDSAINFNFGTQSAHTRISGDTFSARWSGKVQPLYTEPYTFTAQMDDGVRVWINGQLIINDWVPAAGTRISTPVMLVANQTYDVVVEYFEETGEAIARLYWSSPSQAEQIIPTARVQALTPGNAAPTVWLSNPVTGWTYLNGDTIALAANPNDADGSIARVEFWADGAKLGEVTAAPYLWNWPGPRTSGPHTVSAVAIDNFGATGQSTPVTIQTQSLSLLPASMVPTTSPGGEPGVTYTLQTTLPVGRNYVIEWSENLSDWNTLQSGTSTGAPIEVIDATIGLPKRFYRLRITN
jgi:regulation of enolase protein 1 (concanavalin A-like superfamily)/mono/diheme cytochrome c family protein